MHLNLRLKRRETINKKYQGGRVIKFKWRGGEERSKRRGGKEEMGMRDKKARERGRGEGEKRRNR